MMNQSEKELADAAAGTNWRIERLGQLKDATRDVQRRVDNIVSSIGSGKWEGYAASTASAHLIAISETLRNAENWLNEVESLISQTNEHIVDAANRELDQLPSGDLPSAALDAFVQGRIDRLASFGLTGLSKGPAGLVELNAFFVKRREDEADKAWSRVQQRILQASVAIDERIKVGFDDVAPKPPDGPEPGKDGRQTSGTDPRSGADPGSRRPSGVGGGPGLPSGGGNPGGGPAAPGGQGAGGPGPDYPSGGGGGGGTENPQRPDWPWVRHEPPIGDPGYPGGDGPNDGPGGSNGPGGGDLGRRPSVDSNLDGSAMRSGLGAAGLGAAGLAAGAKLASGGGAGSGLGALGQGGIAAGGPGLRGAASVAGSGASAATSGSSNSSGAARGGRPGGMMMGGGGAGGGAEKKSAKSGLGGYIAPKLEDEGEGGPAARASRAGGRQADE